MAHSVLSPQSSFLRVVYCAAMIQKIDDAVSFVRSRTSLQPRVGVILGSGLGDVVESIDVETAIPYGEIPGAKASTVLGHSGRMVFGRAGAVPIVVMQGRVHYYEGHEMAEGDRKRGGEGKRGDLGGR